MPQNRSFPQKAHTLFHLTLGMLYGLILEGILGTAASLNHFGSELGIRTLVQQKQHRNLVTGILHSLNFHHAALSFHALLGLLLVFGSITALTIAWRGDRKVIKGASAVGLLAIVVAAGAGAVQTASSSAAAELVMACGAGIALASYVVILGLL